MPFDPNVEFIGAIGVGQVRAKTETQLQAAASLLGVEHKITSDSTSKNSKIGLRLGAGVQYNFNEHFSTRAMVRYQHVGAGIMKNILSAHVGLMYSI